MRPLELRHLLSDCRLFERLRDDELDRVASFAALRAVNAGETLTLRGARGSTLYLVTRGSARVSAPASRTTVGARLGIGDVVGWSALVEPCCYDSTIVADTGCEVLAVDARALRLYMEARPRVCVAVMLGVASLMREAYGPAMCGEECDHPRAAVANGA